MFRGKKINHDDMVLAENLVTVIGYIDGKVIAQSDEGDFYFCDLKERGEPEDLFEIGDTLDAEAMVPVSDPEMLTECENLL